MHALMKPLTGYIITDNHEVIDGVRPDGTLLFYPLKAQKERDAFATRDMAVKRGTEWGVDWSHFFVKEIGSDSKGNWFV